MSDQLNNVRAKVLIAEDDAIVALDLQGMVQRLGYDVVTIADTGSAAVAAALRFRPDLILLDMVLKGPMDGIDVAREIHKSYDMPVIFCTSMPDLSQLIRAKEISYAGYLLKPINPDSLATNLDTALYKYKLEKRVEQAETKFRDLAGKCDILQYFFDRKASFEWEWSAVSGAQIAGYIPSAGIELSRMEEGIHAFFSERQDVFSLNQDKISGLLEFNAENGPASRYALIGIIDSEKIAAHGLVIPLLNGLE